MAGAAQWVVPIVLGLVAAGAAYGIDQLPKPEPPAQPCIAYNYESPYDTFFGRFGKANLTTARLTVWVVKLDGSTLLASNGGNDTRGHRRDGDFQALPDPLIVAFGNATIPPGGLRLPAALAGFERAIVANLTGLGIGRLAMLRVVDYPWHDVFGPLEVTARVDALYHPDGTLAGGGPHVPPRTYTLPPDSCPHS